MFILERSFSEKSDFQEPYETEKQGAGNRRATCLSEASFARSREPFRSGHICFLAGRMKTSANHMNIQSVYFEMASKPRRK